MTSAAVAYIDQQALNHNLEIIKAQAAKQRIMAVIKADAYGHGLIEVAKSLQKADAFAVAHIEEAVALREAGISQSIFLLQGFANTKELETASTFGLISCLHDTFQLDLLESNPEYPVEVWIKIDTGMGRLGFIERSSRKVSAVAEIVQRLGNSQHVRLTGSMSHFAQADLPDADQTTGKNTEQLRRYQQISLPDTLTRSMANTAAIFTQEDSHFDWIRPGISLYGVSPFHDKTGAELGLKPVMRLVSEVIAIKPVKKNETVGYGGRWTAPNDTHIAVIGAGYGDGYPRHAEDSTPILINDHVYPLAGRVSMDMITVDIGPTPAVKIGDKAQLWGAGNPLETVARHAATIPYELSCRMTSRVKRVYV